MSHRRPPHPLFFVALSMIVAPLLAPGAGRWEARAAEAPPAETPQAEPPKAEPPKVEIPRAEPPKAEAPKVEAPKVEAPKVEPPKVEPPKVELPPVVKPSAPPAPPPQPDQLTVVYAESKDPESRAIVQHYQKSRQIEQWVDVLNSRVKLSRNVKVIVKDCGKVNAFYSPADHTVTICNEFTKSSVALFKQAKYSPQDATEKADLVNGFTFFHEAGHMLINELDLVITGREEDVADQFASFALLNEPEFKRQGPAMVKAAAQRWRLKGTKVTDKSLMDEHPLNDQRVYALLCTLYISDPDGYAPTIGKLGYTTRRLRKCRKEFRQVNRAWRSLLKPHLKQPYGRPSDVKAPDIKAPDVKTPDVEAPPTFD
jgi:Putative metallopeptidase